MSEPKIPREGPLEVQGEQVAARAEVEPRQESGQQELARLPQELPEPLLGPAFAFVCAGIVASISSYLFAAAPSYLEAYATFGLAVPFVVELILDLPVALPAAFMGIACLILWGGWVQPKPSERGLGPLRRVARVGVICTVWVACGFGVSLSMALSSLQAVASGAP